MPAKIVSIPGLKIKSPLGGQFTMEHEPSIQPNVLQPETHAEMENHTHTSLSHTSVYFP